MLNLHLDNIAEKFPLKAALILDDKTYTYADLLSRTRNLAASLLERGINPGDRVAFLLPNCPEIVVCYYACFKIGAIAVPLNIRFDADLLRYVINHSGARVLISDPELFTQLEKIRASLPGVEQYYVVCRHSDFGGVAPFSELLEATLSVDRPPVCEESSPAAIYYTSGTADDRTLIMFSVCYLIGFGSQVLTFHSCGATCILLRYFEPQLALRAIQTYRPTKIYCFPKLYNDLVNYPEAGQYNLRSLDFCFSAGEAIAVAIQQRFNRIFGVEITEGCGMTELQIYSMNPPYGKKKAGSIGKSIVGMEVSLIDDSGRPISQAGEIGEMIVRGGSMTTGYWRDPELTARNIVEGWFHTGDLAYKDEEDFYWFVSRKSEIINHRAGLVSPIEVEGVLYQHPSVLEIGVIGVPDKCGGELVQAHVVLKESSAPVRQEQLVDFARMHLAEYKVPDQIIFSEKLPYGPTGKIDRKTLRENALRQIERESFDSRHLSDHHQGE